MKRQWFFETLRERRPSSQSRLEIGGRGETAAGCVRLFALRLVVCLERFSSSLLLLLLPLTSLLLHLLLRRVICFPGAPWCLVGGMLLLDLVRRLGAQVALAQGA